MTQTPKSLHPSGGWLLLVALVLLSVLLFNILIGVIPSSFTLFDLSAQKISEVSDATRDYLVTLNEDVTFYRICNTGNDDKSFVKLLDHYDQLSAHITVDAVDPAVRPGFVSKYTDEDLSDNSLIVVGPKRSKVLDYNDFLLYNVYYTTDGVSYDLQSQMTYGDFMLFYETYADSFAMGQYTYQTLFVGEDAITSAIDYVISDVIPVVYATAGHGEESLPDSLYAYLDKDNIQISDCATLKNGVPADAAALLINAPSQDFSDEEITALRDYLVAGGDLLFISAHDTLKLEKLRALLKDFGMDAKDNVIAESSQDNYHYYKYFIAPSTNGARDFYSLDSYTLLAPNCHPISMVQGKYQVTYTSLFSTSDEAYLEPFDQEDGENNGSVNKEETTGRYDVGAIVTINGTKSGHICWLSSFEILDTEWNTSSGGGNFTYFLAILENLCEKKYSLSISSKVLDSDVLVLSNLQVGFWGVILIVLIPVSVLGVGAVILIKRKYRSCR